MSTQMIINIHRHKDIMHIRNGLKNLLTYQSSACMYSIDPEQVYNDLYHIERSLDQQKMDEFPNCFFF